jgi:hypothetical protein
MACGGSTDGGAGGSAAASGAGATGGSGGSSGSGAQGGNGGCQAIAPCCDSQGNEVAPICPGGGPPQCPPGASVPPTGICSAPGCSPQQPCSGSEYCNYPDDLCGAGAIGTCKPRPAGCNLLFAPVCGCDGGVHGNDCGARSSGSDVSVAGGCTAPEGQFGCGALFCSLASQYCSRGISDVGGPDEYYCKPLPSSCGQAPSCACMTGEACADWCETSALGAITLTCPGG